ncbi:MAG: hypothetical protein WAM91_13270 [Candidatus Acidiferrales bacterium]
MLRELQILQIRASQLSEKELRRAALWSAGFVFVAPAIVWLISYFGFPNHAVERPTWFDISVYVMALPLAPGFLVGGGLTSLIEHLSGSRSAAIDWSCMLVGFVVNWYLYFLIFSLWIGWRNKRKQQRAAAQRA